MSKTYKDSGKMPAQKSMDSMKKSPISAVTKVAPSPDSGRRGYITMTNKPKRMPKVGAC